MVMEDKYSFKDFYFFSCKIYSYIMYLLKFWISHDFRDFIDSTEIFIYLNR